MTDVVITDGRRSWPLPHGLDPTDVLAAHGLVGEPVGSGRDGHGRVAVRYEVREVGEPVAVTPPEPTGPRQQRLGAYALVVDRGCLLLSRLAGHVPGVGGLWTLPGGGVEPGERPVEATVREVWEEAGQEVLVEGLVQVQTAHWAGEGEDFHAVRLIHRARCPHPRPARVTEVDGSTGEAAWVPFDEVSSLPQTGMIAPAVRFVGA